MNASLDDVIQPDFAMCFHRERILVHLLGKPMRILQRNRVSFLSLKRFRCFQSRPCASESGALNSNQTRDRHLPR